MKSTVKKTLSLATRILTAIVWGVAFVAQRQGSESIGAFTLLSSRSFVAVAALLPVIGVRSLFGGKKASHSSRKTLWVGGTLCGIALATASALQQIGINYTTAGKAGFITALYIIIVPIIAVFFKKRASLFVWIGVALATAGMYFLCMDSGFSVSKGDMFVFGCAFCFSVQIMLVDHFAPKVDGVKLACVQFLVCGAVCVLPALVLEQPTVQVFKDAMIPILYLGLVSSGVGYTLQIVAQKHVQPALASLVMSLESVFAVLSGWLILDETLSQREIIGCALMFAAILLAQVKVRKEK